MLGICFIKSSDKSNSDPYARALGVCVGACVCVALAKVVLLHCVCVPHTVVGGSG